MTLVSSFVPFRSCFHINKQCSKPVPVSNATARARVSSVIYVPVSTSRHSLMLIVIHFAYATHHASHALIAVAATEMTYTVSYVAIVSIHLLHIHASPAKRHYKLKRNQVYCIHPVDRTLFRFSAHHN